MDLNISLYKINSASVSSRSLLFLCLLVVGFVYVIGINNGTFWFQGDSPRHAMNGVFIRDLIISSPPLSNLKEFVFSYYAAYPILSLGTYPPLFPFIEGLAFFFLGVSETTAKLVVIAFVILGCWGFFKLLDYLYNSLVAALATLVLYLAPAMTLWGRQVMLELPVICFIIWSVYFFIRFMDDGRKKWLILSAIFLLFALYTKQTAFFLLPLFFFYPAMKKKWRFYKNPSTYFISLVFIVLMTPLLLMSIKFQSVYVLQSVGTGGEVLGAPARWSLENWFYYPGHLLEQLGWLNFIMLILFSFYFLCTYVFAGGQKNIPQNNIKNHIGFFVAWILIAYLIFSYISRKEVRHIIVWLPAFAGLLAWMINNIVLSRLKSNAALAVIVVCLVNFLDVCINREPFAKGPEEAANFVSEIYKGGNVLYSGLHNGSFIFQIRAINTNQTIPTLLANKILYSMKVHKEYGIKILAKDEKQILEILNRYQIRYLVIEKGYNFDLQPLQTLWRIAHKPDVKHLAKFHLHGYPTLWYDQPTDIDIFELKESNSQLSDNLRLPVQPVGKAIIMPMKLLGKPFSSFGKEDLSAIRIEPLRKDEIL